MRTVCIESPLAGNATLNLAYAKACVHDCFTRGESPYASHLLLAQEGILDDMKPEERKLGIEAGFCWSAKADAVVVYIDRGVSSGMRLGIRRAVDAGQPLEVRSLEREVSAEEAAAIIREAMGR